jgi:hypothetical protein
MEEIQDHIQRHVKYRFLYLFDIALSNVYVMPKYRPVIRRLRMEMRDMDNHDRGTISPFSCRMRY